MREIYCARGTRLAALAALLSVTFAGACRGTSSALAPGTAIDRDLLAITYAWEQATHLRKPPTLVETGLMAVTPAQEGRAQRGPGHE